MSLLFVNQQETSAVLISDTLTTHGSEPFKFGPKVATMPHLNMVIASLGSENFGDAWRRAVESAPGMTDIESVNNETPASLRRLYADLSEKFGGPLESSTIYHYGFPAGTDTLVSYTYRSHADFESERFEGSRFTVKPVPPDYQFEIPMTAAEVVDLAILVRDLNDAQPPGGWGVGIGGELYATLVENWETTTVRWHRFDDYEADLAAIQSGVAGRR